MEPPEYVCPKCKSSLTATESGFRRGRCALRYPLFFGIPDFRLGVGDDIRYLEMQKIEGILKEYEHAGKFDRLMERHVRAHTTSHLVAHELAYELAWKRRGSEVKERLQTLQRRLVGQHERGADRYLDVGCGKGAALITFCREFEDVYGVDVVPRYLVFAKILAQEGGASHLHLACASADALPFRSEMFDLVTALDLIEHLPRQIEGLREIWRTVREGGLAYLNSPNRFSLFALEDHVRLWGVGFLPRKWMGRYVRLVRRYAYEGVRLLSVFELARLLGNLPDCTYCIEGLMVTYREGMAKKMLAALPVLVWALNTFARWFVPSYNVTMRKADSNP
ncbi:MAG: class I SAM-dependent methyltransferase [Betaproteobacteria bacterium]|nr:class I SAM-dependent methyltransferase [Betaproteobacteria bacterium]